MFGQVAASVTVCDAGALFRDGFQEVAEHQVFCSFMPAALRGVGEAASQASS
jgi:hypothetical protein